MERTAWTDARLDDLSHRMDAGFSRLDSDLRDLREEGGRRFDAVDRRIDSLGTEIRGEIEALRLTILRVGGGMMIGLVGVIAAVLARGV